MSELSVRETAARAGYDALNAWAHRPLAEHIADRDPDASLSAAIADAVLAAVADHDGFAERLARVLLEHQPGNGYPWNDGHELRAVTCWCEWTTPSEHFAWRLREHHRKHVAAHLADVVRAWLRGES